MWQVILAMMILLVLGAGLFISGIYLILGLGYAALAGGLFCFLAVAFLRFGAVVNG